ncbi:MAG: hypothetical protein KF704_08385 [Crocinitomicaceae bacterium]|nr:hypothetical protein [Crocinitomicaceae bacterium]
MFKAVYIIVGLLLIVSCSNYRVYRFHSLGTERYCILNNKGELEHFVPDRFNTQYFWNIDAGATKEELKEAGSEKKIAGYSILYQITQNDSGFVYKTINDEGTVVINVFPIKQKIDTCFIVKSPFIELSGYDGSGFSNNVKQPWHDFYGKKVADTTYYFNSQEPVKAVLVELAPYRSAIKDSCSYTSPIKIIIDKENGIPLHYEYPAIYFDGSEKTIYKENISCSDYKIVRMSKKQLKKILW